MQVKDSGTAFVEAVAVTCGQIQNSFWKEDGKICG